MLSLFYPMNRLLETLLPLFFKFRDNFSKSCYNSLIYSILGGCPMKKMLSLFLALIMAFSAVSALAEALPKDDALPQTGDVIYGFEAKEIREFPLIGAQIVLFEHQKTGAQVTYIANSDTNRAFQLTFTTRPIDNTGLPHVFEHALTSGSEKYPSTNIWMNVAYQTYNTYINAYTTDAMTCYPVASLSEEQLLHLADFYISMCFEPLILRDESIYRTEAWRYNMADTDDELTIKGTVYTEMQGAYTLSRAALLNANRATFPGGSLCYDYGGDPDYIPDMTYEALKSYHELFYHPSNCMAYLYGDLEDYGAFLALLDAAFSPYEKSDFTYEQVDYTRITEPVTAEYPFAMAEGSDTENQSYIYYYIVCPGLRENLEQESVVDHLCSLLSLKSSPLMQNLLKALPTGSFSVGRELAAPDDAILFLAANVNQGDADLFKETVDLSLREIAETGFAQDMVDAAMTSLNISSKLAPESGNPVEGVIYSMAYDYVVTGNPFDYVEGTAALEDIDEENQQGLYKAAIADWLLDQELYTLTTTYPAPGMKEEHDAALAEYLAGVKAQMTEEEKQAIIDMTNAEPVTDDTSEMMAQIKAITVESLPEEARVYPVSDLTGEDGIRRIDVTAGVDGIGYAAVYFDAATLPQEDIHWMRLFTRLLGTLDTDAHTKEELDVLVSRYLYDKTIGVSVDRLADGTIHPYLIVSWYALDDDLAAGYDLMNELLFHTQFTDTQKLLERVQAQKASVRSTINSSAYSIMLYRGLAADDPFSLYYGYLNFVDYYAFLEDLEAQLNEDPESVTARFQAVQKFFANNAGAISAFAGNEESIALNRPLADAFLSALPHEEREAAVYDLPIPAEREAMIIDSNIQFNSVIASLKDLGLEDNDLSLSVVTTLVADQILTPVLRDQLGVYTPLNNYTTDKGMYLITNRDPNLADTFAVYQSLPEWIAAMEVEQDTLDGYIMSVYSELAKQEGELTGAVSAISTVLDGKAQDEKLAYMEQIKAVTPEAVQAAAAYYQKAWDNGVHSSAGSAAAINANADLFDVILNPFGAVDASQVELTDVPEGSELYDAVRFVFEEGLMSAKTEDTFGVDETATAGDLYGALYVIIGGSPNAGEEAMEYLGQFGLVPDGLTVDTELTNGMSDQIFVMFGMAIGMELQADEPNETTNQPITRGEMAEQLLLLCSLLQ